MDKKISNLPRLELVNANFISTPADFGEYYSGSRKAKQMKRKRGAMLNSTIKGKVLKHNSQNKYS